MATTTYRDTNHNPEYDERSSRQLQRDIDETRHQMDETLEEIGERLHPKHLLDAALDMFRSSDVSSERRREYTRQARDAGQQVVAKIKEHPLPTMLVGAGLAWLLFEELNQEDPETRRARRVREMRAHWDDIPEYSGSFVDARTGEPYDDSYGAKWKGAAAWSDEYEWEGDEQERESWSNRATRTLSELKSSLGDTSSSARHKIQATAAKLMSLSGRKRRDLHEQWANLREHSGSFVDARTGEPYSSAYGREFRDLTACDFAATHEWSSEDETSWSEKAQHVLEDIQQTLSDTGRSATHTLKALAGHIGDFVGSTRDMAAHYGTRARHQGGRLRSGSRHAAGRMQHQLQDGYARGRDQFSRAIDESPLAVGAAFLGLGLIAGLIFPSTRREDEWMGESSDELKQRAIDSGKEAVQRGQQVAAATAEAAADQMEKEGLTPHQLAEKARKVAAEVKQEVQETVREETGSTEDLKGKITDVAQRAKDAAQQEARKQKEEMQR